MEAKAPTAIHTALDAGSEAKPGSSVIQRDSFESQKETSSDKLKEYHDIKIEKKSNMSPSESSSSESSSSESSSSSSLSSLSLSEFTEPTEPTEPTESTESTEPTESTEDSTEETESSESKIDLKTKGADDLAAFAQKAGAERTPNTNAKETPLTSEELSKELLELPELAEVLMNPEKKKDHLAALVRVRKLLSVERNPPVEEVIRTGVVPFLIAFLAQTDKKVQFEACWALTNIASSHSNHTKVVIGATPLLARLLEDSDVDLSEQAVWCIGNLAGDGPEHRDLMLRYGVLTPLAALCSKPTAKLSTLRNATWTISNLCRGKPQPPFELVKEALPTLANLLYHKDDEVLTDACWALSYLSDGENTKIQAVIQAGVCRRIVELLLHKNLNIKTPALRVVGNIVTGDDLQTQVMLNCALLPVIRVLLTHERKGIRKEACWTISNITAGNSDQIQAVIDAGLVAPLIDILNSPREVPEVKKEAVWAISNLTSGGTNAQIESLVEHEGVRALCLSLTSIPDPQIHRVALEGLENILKSARRTGFRRAGSAAAASSTFSSILELVRTYGLESIQKLADNTGGPENAMRVLDMIRGPSPPPPRTDETPTDEVEEEAAPLGEDNAEGDFVPTANNAEE